MLSHLLSTLSDGKTRHVNIGLHWTAVVIETDEALRCGLASTLTNAHKRHGEPDAPQAGQLETLSGLELATLAQSEQPLLASVGVAAINALIPPRPHAWVNLNAEEVIAEHGAGKKVALVGHFPFIPRLREQVGHLWVLEKQPRGDDLSADEAERVIPQADVVAITGTTLINNTFEALIELCRPSARVLVLGPSTPLSPTMFDYGIDLISGTIVEDVPTVLAAVGQGANFRQIRHMGVRLVTIQK